MACCGFRDKPLGPRGRSFDPYHLGFVRRSVEEKKEIACPALSPPSLTSAPWMRFPGRTRSSIAMDPRIKVMTTLVFIVCVVSFGKHEISALVPFLVYPVFLIVLGDLPVAYLLRKVMVAAPFAVLHRDIQPPAGPGGSLPGGAGGNLWRLDLLPSILLRFMMTVGAALILIATTGYNAVCMALEKMGAPRVFVVQLLFLYRYLFVLVNEASRMVRARAPRFPSGKRLGHEGVGSMAGHLLLRTMDRAQRIHLAMLCRGFDGNLRSFRPLKVRGWGSCDVPLGMVNPFPFAASATMSLSFSAGGLQGFVL